MRAYVVAASDEVIGSTLRALAPGDYRMAGVFPIPARFKLVSEHGTLDGAVTLSDFHSHQEVILESAFRALEREFVPFQGLDARSESGVTGVAEIVRFPSNPYLVTTTLTEPAPPRAAAGCNRPGLRP